MLLFADWVVPVSSAPLPEAGVRIAAGRIVEVGPAVQLRARSEGEEIRAFPGCVLLPGFVNSHSHLELSVFRGFVRPSGFGRWMLNLLLARRRLDRADYEASALWGAQECARCGIVSLADTAFDGRAVARAVAAVGLRARVHQEVFGLDDTALPRTMERYRAAITGLQDESASIPPAFPGAPVVEAGVSPHAPYTVSARLYREAARFARRNGLHLATHVAESPAEVELLTRGTGPIAQAHRLARLWSGSPWTPPRLRPLEYVAGTGVLSRETLVIHAVEVDSREVGLLAASGAAVAHCPRSNARLRCAEAPIADFLAADVIVGLGTDSLASNDSLDMFAEMRAALAAAERRGGAPAFTSDTVLRMATLEGARALGWEKETGSLEPGKSADIIAVRIPAGSSAVVDALVTAGGAEDVRMTMVAGNVIHSAGTRAPGDGSAFRAARQKLGLEG